MSWKIKHRPTSERKAEAPVKEGQFVEGPFENSGENDAFAFTLEEQTCTLSSSAEPVISVSIGGIRRNMMIDSDVASNLVNLSTVQELKHYGLR